MQMKVSNKYLTKSNITLLCILIALFTMIVEAFLIREASTESIRKVLSNKGGVIIVEGPYDNKPKSGLLDSSEYENYNTAIKSAVSEIEESFDVKYVDYHYHKKLCSGNGNDNSKVFFDELGTYITYVKEISQAIVDDEINDLLINSDNENLIEFLPLLYPPINLIGDDDPYLMESRSNKAFKVYNDKINGYNGRYFTKEEIDNGDFVCILPISYFCCYDALVNNTDYPYSVYSISDDSYSSGVRPVELGDEIILVDYFVKDNELIHVNSYKFTVIGFYSNANEYHEAIYVPNNAIVRINDEQAALMEKYDCTIQNSSSNGNSISRIANITKSTYTGRVRIEVKNAEDIKPIGALIKENCASIENAKVITSSKEYDQISAPIKSLNNISLIALIIVNVVSLIIVSLILFLNVKGRMKEIGLLLALGKSKKKLVSEMIREYALIATVAMIVSFIIGNSISGTVSKYLVNNYRVPSVNAETHYYNVSQNEMKDSFKINLTTENAVMIGCLCYGVTVVSSLAGIHVIRKANPKEILLYEQ